MKSIAFRFLGQPLRQKCQNQILMARLGSPRAHVPHLQGVSPPPKVINGLHGFDDGIKFLGDLVEEVDAGRGRSFEPSDVSVGDCGRFLRADMLESTNSTGTMCIKKKKEPLDQISFTRLLRLF